MLLAGAATSILLLDKPSLSCLDRSQKDRVERMPALMQNLSRVERMLVALYGPTRDKIEHNGGKIKYESRYLVSVHVSPPASVRVSQPATCLLSVRHHRESKHVFGRLWRYGLGQEEAELLRGFIEPPEREPCSIDFESSRWGELVTQTYQREADFKWGKLKHCSSRHKQKAKVVAAIESVYLTSC